MVNGINGILRDMAHRQMADSVNSTGNNNQIVESRTRQSSTNHQGPATAIWPTPKMADNDYIVYPMISFVFGFPLLVITVLCALQKRNACAEKQKRPMMPHLKRNSCSSCTDYADSMLGDSLGRDQLYFYPRSMRGSQSSQFSSATQSGRYLTPIPSSGVVSYNSIQMQPPSNCGGSGRFRLAKPPPPFLGHPANRRHKSVGTSISFVREMLARPQRLLQLHQLHRSSSIPNIVVQHSPSIEDDVCADDDEEQVVVIKSRSALNLTAASHSPKERRRAGSSGKAGSPGFITITITGPT